VDSHDAARPLYYLTNTWDDKAKDALKALSFFLYTIPGALPPSTVTRLEQPTKGSLVAIRTGHNR